MRTALYIFGRILQVLGMGTVFIAFISFFTTPNMGMMMKTTLLGIVEFYAGYFILTQTGDKE
jgi:hypothetical protein